MLIYHTSDLHDHRGIAEPLRALRAAAPGMLFDCGDSLRGSQTVYHRSEPIIADIDAAGYDAQGMGNREFHYLQSVVRARAAQMRHPLICSNLESNGTGASPFLDHLRITYQGQRFYVFSLLVVQYPPGSFWERIFGWRFRDPFEATRDHLARADADETVVLLSHVGLRTDRRIAQNFSRINLLLGGHSHDTLEQPEFVNGVPIVHAGPYGKFVSQSVMQPNDFAPMSLRDFRLAPLLDA